MSITTYLQQILAARYGKDVRQSIHDAIEEGYNIAVQAQGTAETSQESAEAYAAAALASEQAAQNYMNQAEQYKDEAFSGTPTGYADLVAKVNSIYKETASSFGVVGTVEGLALAHTIYGMSEQDGTPTPSVPVDIDSAVANFKIDNENLISFPYSRSSNGSVSNGITYTYDNDGTIHLNGTATAEAYFSISYNLTTLKKFYNDYISGTVRIGLYASEISNANTVRLGYYLYDKDNYLYRGGHQSSNEPLSLDLNYNNYEYDHHIIYIRVVSGSVLNDFTLKPRLFFAYGSNSTEAYNNMIALKNNAYVRGVNNTITTDLTLRAIEVTSSDDYNLVKDGKYYIADTLDWDEDSGYSITRRLTYETPTTPDTDMSGSTLSISLSSTLAVKNNLKYAVCNTAVYKNDVYYTTRANANTNLNDGEICSRSTGTETLQFYFKTGASTFADAETILANTKILAVLATPTTETITSAQAQALLGLKTYDEATSIDATGDVAPSVTLEYSKDRNTALALIGHNMAHINALKIADLSA